jgi:hypothetical protein
MMRARPKKFEWLRQRGVIDALGAAPLALNGVNGNN